MQSARRKNPAGRVALISGALALVAALLSALPAGAADATTWVDGGVVISSYGNRVRQNMEERHAGVDIGKPRKAGGYESGVPVKAGCKGKVVKVYKFNGKHTASGDALNNLSGWLENFNTVVIKCEEGEFAGKFIVFVHFDAISVKEGDAVDAATQVGTTGGYGQKCAKTFGPHVHIEVRAMDPDDRNTPADEGAWDSVDERRVATQDYALSQNPLASPPKKKNGKATEKSGQPGSGSLIAGSHLQVERFEYEVANDSTSEEAIDYFRVRYEASSAYFNVTAPPGWASESYGDSPEAVTWFATDPAFAIPPGGSLSGFAYEANNVLRTLVLFSIGPDDAGGGPLAADGFFVIGAADEVLPIAVPTASTWALAATAVLLCGLSLLGLRRQRRSAP